MIRFYLPAYSAHVCIESANTNHNIFRQSQTSRPLLTDCACSFIGSVSFGKQFLSKSFQQRIEPCKEIIRRQSAKSFCPQGFVAGRANASFHLPDILATDK